MMLVDKETGKGYVEMEKVYRDKKEYASKGVAGTALGLGIAGTALALFNNGFGGNLFSCRGAAADGAVAAASIANLAKDEVYNKLSGELQMLIQEELINSVKDKVANSPRGKELLEKQLNNIRTKKDSIIEEANRELELFKKFQIAAQANPKLTYVEFCKTINNE